MIRALSFLPTATALLFTVSCGGKNPVSVSIKGSNSQTFIVPAGSEFTVTLGTVGPGEYSSPPTVSSEVVQFLDVSLVGPYVPAGPTQRFHFSARDTWHSDRNFSAHWYEPHRRGHCPGSLCKDSGARLVIIPTS